MSDVYFLVAGDREGTIEFFEQGAVATVRFQGRAKERTPSERLGQVYWDAMKEAGVNPTTVNGFELYHEGRKGTRVASLLPVLEGARVVWLVLYRADRAASAFKPLGSKQRIGDALDLTFQTLRGEIFLPHKP